MKDKKNYLINENKLLFEAIKILEINYSKVLVVVNSNKKLVGTISDGDIRRRLISDGNINISCGELANKNCLFSERFEVPYKTELAKKKGISILPVVNKENEVLDLIQLSKPPKVINNAVVIMAGGKGKRLRPLTNTIPKPLLKVGDKPIIRRITDKFSDEGFKNFVISVGYLSQKFFDYYENKDKTIEPFFINEKKPLGTAGPLVDLLNIKDITYPVVVTNGDIIFEDNISSVLDYFETSGIDGMMFCREEYNSIPYGVVEFDDELNFKNIKEKPKYKYLVNGGIYILTKKIIKLISKGEEIDMPDLFLKARSKKYNLKVHTLRDYWIDVGRIDKLQLASEKFN